MRNFLLVLLVAFSPSLWADDLPACVGTDGVTLPVNNGEILRWKFSTANHFKAPAHARGVLTRFFSNRSRHQHFEIQIGIQTQDTVEIVYSSKFGNLPRLEVGSVVEACGDYLTANAPYDTFEASPSGAIIHWVHRSSNPDRHPSGFLAIDDVAYGI